ncbi:hypothetical protein [Pseudomonas sp. FP1742]|uniref:hypothetical protein n=1 Tax=Pseudomonas sp. FP1742 TaxID=2954079 RepID=UPI00273301E2|nr:hypothetical protein [Pseudomonas sp. FP1742]WLG53403.1 hypothetical protein PSH64_13110 [Pseudomonas sp. FP1742]
MNQRHTAANYNLQPSSPQDITPRLKQGIEGDKIERGKIIAQLKKAISGKENNEQIDWEELFITVTEGSSFEQALRPGAVMLRNMIDKPAFKEVLAYYAVHPDASFYVVDAGHIIASHNGREIRLTAKTKLDPDLNDDLVAIADIAATIDRVVFFDNQLGVAQWITFHEYELPEDVKRIKNLIKHLEFDYHPSPALGNYWEAITGSEDKALVLSADDRQTIRTLTAQHIGGRGKLLVDLCSIVLGNRSKTANRLNCRELLHELGIHPYFKSWSENYLKALDWYGSKSGESVSELNLEQALMTAIILDIYPDAGGDERRNHIAGYNLYAPENIEKSVPEVFTELERHLENEHDIPSNTSTLAAYLLLAGRAPEFLVRDLPESLRLGTPEWITFCRGVAIAEANACGSVLSMTFANVMQLEAIEPVNKQLEILHSVLSVDPIIDWALLNNVITLEQVISDYKGSGDRAIEAYQTFADVYSQAVATLSAPLPSRKAISREILEQIVPDCDFIDEKILFEKQRGWHEFNNFEPLAMSMVELNMSNHLGTLNWDLKKSPGIYQKFPHLVPNLVSTEGIFKRRFDQAYAPLEKAMASIVNLALSALPPTDRVRLLCGEVTFFTIRPSVAIIQPPDLFPQEKQKAKDEATGRYGVVMCSRYEGRLYCYELFTLHGECRENPQLAALVQKEGLLAQPARLDFTDHINSLSKAAKIHNLPTDIESYTHGVPPGNTQSSHGVIEKLGSLNASVKTRRTVKPGYYESYQSEEFSTLTNFILKHRPLWTYAELIEDARGRTALEQRYLKEEQQFETFINIIVPFKSCIEDFFSDDPDRNRGSTLSCTLELAMTVLLVVGVAAKAVSVAAKAVSTASKARALAKLGLGFLHSVFNPLDGTPELILGVGKYLKKGVSGISRAGLNSLENATHQLRRLTGSADAYDLIKAAQRTDIGQGIWRPLGSSGDSFVVSAVRMQDNWYALNRVGQPWGKKLIDFKLSFKSHFLRRLMPDSFVFSYVKKSLPIAQTKIDTALQQLLTTRGDFEVNSLIKYVFGNDSAATFEHLAEALSTMKKDIKHVTLNNVILETFPGERSLASMYTDRFEAWKASNYQPDTFNSKFLSINSDEMTQYFQATKFDTGRVADGIVHEMSHGSQRTLDLMYADIDPKNGLSGHIDVTQLMNLAKKPKGLSTAGMSEVVEQGFSKFEKIKGSLPRIVAESPALLNADSYALAVALLNQRSANYPRFLDNLVQMKNKYNAVAKDKYIKEAVIVNLSSFD